MAPCLVRAGRLGEQLARGYVRDLDAAIEERAVDGAIGAGPDPDSVTGPDDGRP